MNDKPNIKTDLLKLCWEILSMVLEDERAQEHLIDRAEELTSRWEAASEEDFPHSHERRHLLMAIQAMHNAGAPCPECGFADKHGDGCPLEKKILEAGL